MKRVIGFDLDDTLAVTKSPISDKMSRLLGELLEKYEVCIISGGRFEQFQIQVIERLEVAPHVLNRLHIMPTCGTSYYRFDDIHSKWVQRYAENLTDSEKHKIIETLKEGAQHLGYWEAKPFGEIIEDRGSQVTYSALGQQAPPENKYAWDPDHTKKHAIRDYVAERLPEFECRVGGTTSIDITKPGIDKAYGMRKLMAELGIGEADILFIGDKLEEGGNDYPVKAMGIESIQVERWEDTALVIETILKVA